MNAARPPEGTPPPPVTAGRNQPQSGNAMPRFAGLATMMRLPAASTPS